MPSGERPVVHLPATEVTTLLISDDGVSYAPGCPDTGSIVTTFITAPSGEDDPAPVTMCTVVPPGEGVRPRTHDDIDESFYGLDGDLELTAGGEVLLIGPDAYALVPGGVRHSWRNTGGVPVRVLRTCKPAGPQSHPFRVATGG